VFVGADLSIQPARKKSADEGLKGERDSPFSRPPDNQQPFPEKSSWRSLTKGSSGTAQWRTATCKLAEEKEGCQLNVYIEVRRLSGFAKSVWPEIQGFPLSFRF
jgi:hypothetical protein